MFSSQVKKIQIDQVDSRIDNRGELSIFAIEICAVIFNYLSIADLFKYRKVCAAFQLIIDQHAFSKKITISDITKANSFQEALLLAGYFRITPHYEALKNKIKNSPDELLMDEVFLYALTTDDIHTIPSLIFENAILKHYKEDKKTRDDIRKLSDKIAEESQEMSASKQGDEEVPITYTDHAINAKSHDALTQLKLKFTHANSCIISLKTTANTIALNEINPKEGIIGWAFLMWMMHRMPLHLPFSPYKKVFVNLNGAELSKLDFYFMPDDAAKDKGVIMENASFLYASLSGSNLNMTSFKYCSFANANLSDCSFVGAHLSHICFSHAIMPKTNFAEAEIHADFTGADLTDASFINAKIMHINLSNATLKNVNLKNAKITHATFLDNVTILDLKERLHSIINLLKQNGFSNKEIANFREGLVNEIISAATNMSPHTGEALLTAAIELKEIFGLKQEVSIAVSSLLTVVSSKTTSEPTSCSERTLIAARSDLRANLHSAHLGTRVTLNT